MENILTTTESKSLYCQKDLSQEETIYFQNAIDLSPDQRTVITTLKERHSYFAYQIEMKPITRVDLLIWSCRVHKE